MLRDGENVKFPTLGRMGQTAYRILGDGCALRRGPVADPKSRLGTIDTNELCK